jgi:hypothetical protein
MTTLKQEQPLPAGPRFSLRPALLVPVLAVAFAAAVGLALIAMIGVSVPNAISAFVDGTVGSPMRSPPRSIAARCSPWSVSASCSPIAPI